jgi:DNA-binding SARP family transcriptional activator
VVDDLPPLAAEAVNTLVDSVNDLPETVTVVLSSRWPLAAPATRWIGRGMWTELGPADLALTADEVADLIRAEYALTDPDLAERLHEATGGWPALVHLAAETLRMHGVPRGPLAPAVAAPGSPLAGYLADEVLSVLPPEATRLIRNVGELKPVSAELCRALGHRRAGEMFRLLTRTGVLTHAGSSPLPGAPVAGQRIVPVIAEVVRHGQRRPGYQRPAKMSATAAAWYDENGPAVAAARAFRQAGDDERCARVLEEHGRSTLLTGHADAVVALVRELPEGLRTRRLRLLLGDALRMRGEIDAAMRAYDAVAAARPECDAALAWRRGRVEYQRGNARAALDAFATAPATETSGADAALLLAYTADAHLLAGDTETATAYARRALTAAVDAGDDPALATAYVSLALCHGAVGDVAGSEERYAMALPVAERTGDVHLLSRICTNQTFHLLCAARYADALATAQRSACYAAAAGSAALRAIATCNEADALTLLGRYDEAVKHYAAALSRYQRMGSRRVAAVQLGLGDVYRRRGWGEQARAAYEEAVRVAGEAGNAHVLVPALAGLALVMLDADPAAAAVHADRAEAGACTDIIGPALLAQGWVALHGGDRTRAQTLATEAARVARAQHHRAGLADALELRAATETDRACVRAALRESQAIWTEAGATVEAARILVALANLPEASTDERLGGLLAAERLATAGALAHRPGTVSDAPRAAGPAGGDVVIRALGRFEVEVGDHTVPASRWQSRKARDLLRILVARRGRPVPRGELCELLWPDDDPDRTGHRLSVLLSIVRGVLDPARACATDHYLVADQASIALDIARVRVDVEEFLAHVAHGRRLVDRGAFAEAHTLLVAVERQYRADAFEDEPYAEWSRPMREEARAAYLTVLRMLAQVSRVAAGPGAAVGYLLRLLERDPYDESAHRALVRTLVAGGQHGEARRAFARYGEAMRSIGVRPPDEVVLAPARAGRPR